MYQILSNKPNKLEETPTQLVVTNGKSLKLLGEVQLKLEVKRKVFPYTASVGRKVVHLMIAGVEFIIKRGGVTNFKDHQLASDGTGEQIDEDDISSVPETFVSEYKEITVPPMADTLINNVHFTL